jgi:hypothetical protein
MKLDITIANPTVVVPMNSASDDVLALDLGVITIQNKFIKETNTSENILLEIHDLGIASAKMTGKNMRTVDKIFHVKQLGVDVTRTLDSKIPFMRVCLMKY